MVMRIFILEDDDYRNSQFRETLFHTDATFTTSYDEAVKAYNGPYDVVCLDHDLGGQQMVSSQEQNTGYQFTKWMPPAGSIPPVVFIHSYNPNGAENMFQELTSKGYQPIKMPFGPTILSVLKSLYTQR